MCVCVFFPSILDINAQNHIHYKPLASHVFVRASTATATDILLFVYFQVVRESRIFVETSKSGPTRARLGNWELADEAELVSLAVG